MWMDLGLRLGLPTVLVWSARLSARLHGQPRWQSRWQSRLRSRSHRDAGSVSSTGWPGPTRCSSSPVWRRCSSRGGPPGAASWRCGTPPAPPRRSPERWNWCSPPGPASASAPCPPPWCRWAGCSTSWWPCRPARRPDRRCTGGPGWREPRSVWWPGAGWCPWWTTRASTAGASAPSIRPTSWCGKPPPTRCPPPPTPRRSTAARPAGSPRPAGWWPASGTRSPTPTCAPRPPPPKPATTPTRWPPPPRCGWCRPTTGPTGGPTWVGGCRPRPRRSTPRPRWPFGSRRPPASTSSPARNPSRTTGLTATTATTATATTATATAPTWSWTGSGPWWRWAAWPTAAWCSTPPSCGPPRPRCSTASVRRSRTTSS